MQFFIVHASLEARDGVQDTRRLTDVAGRGILGGHGGVEGIGGVGRSFGIALAPDGVGDVVVFAQVGKGYDVAVALIASRFVGYP